MPMKDIKLTLCHTFAFYVVCFLLAENLVFNHHEKVEAKMSLFITFCCFNRDTEGLGYIQVEK